MFCVIPLVTDKDMSKDVVTRFYDLFPDNEPPLLLCPTTVRTETNPGESFATGVTWDDIFATDNSRFVFPAEGSHDENSMFPVGPTTVTYSALDPSGNRGTCSFFVIVEGMCYINV